MVDSTSDAKTLFSLVCEKRRRIDGSRHPAQHYASPEVATGVYAAAARDEAAPEMASVEMPLELLQEIDATVEEIVVELVPEWRPFFAIPIRWRLLADPAIGSDSAPHIPQTIYLGAKKFETRGALREQVVHEMSHVWIGMVLEIAPCAREGQQRFALPSGLSDKRAWQVALALCFAASVLKMYRALFIHGRSTPERIARADWASNYARRCISTLKGSGLLTDSGIDIVASCEREIELVAA